MTKSKGIRTPRNVVREDLARGLAGGLECVHWRGNHLSAHSYSGRVSHNGQSTRAHIVIWAMAGRVVPPGMTIDHSCHDPRFCQGGDECPHRKCINLDHLRLATRKEQQINSVNTNHGKTCRNGHPWTEENIYVSPKGIRACRICRAKNARKGEEKRKAAKRQKNIGGPSRLESTRSDPTGTS